MLVARSGRSDISHFLNQSGGKRSVVRQNMIFYQFSPLLLVIASTRCAESKLKKFQIYLTCVNPGKSEFFHKGGARSFSGFVRISQITTHLNDNALVEANHGVDGGACLWWKNGFGEEFQ